MSGSVHGVQNKTNKRRVNRQIQKGLVWNGETSLATLDANNVAHGFRQAGLMTAEAVLTGLGAPPSVRGNAKRYFSPAVFKPLVCRKPELTSTTFSHLTKQDTPFNKEAEPLTSPVGGFLWLKIKGFDKLN